MRRRGECQCTRAESETAVLRIDEAQNIFQIALTIQDHCFRGVAIVAEQRPVASQIPFAIRICRIGPLRVQMQLNVVALAISFPRLRVPGVSVFF